MPNHIHLLARIGKTPIGTFMQPLLLSYAKWWNLKYHQVGHLFQGRYKPIFCDRDEYLRVLIRYIHLNPVRAKLVLKPEEWQWSSLSTYLKQPVPWIETETILKTFAPDPRQAKERFDIFIREGFLQAEPQWAISKGRYVWPEKRSQIQRTKNIPVILSSRIPSSDLEIPLPTDESLLTIACENQNFSANQLVSSSRALEIVMTRVALAQATWQWWGWSAARAGILLKKSPAALVSMRKKCRPHPPKEVGRLIVSWETLLRKDIPGA
jgi:hypothetical protein